MNCYKTTKGQNIRSIPEKYGKVSRPCSPGPSNRKSWVPD